MAEQKKKVAPVEIAEVDEGTEVLAPETGENLPVQAPHMEMGQATGDIGAGDIKFPSLRIMQKMSDNPDKLDDGTITLDNTTVIEDAKGVVRLSILSIHKYFKEVLPFGAGTPQTFDTAEEAVANGFRIARSKADRDAGVPLVEDAARAIIVIEKPEGAMDRSFPLELADGVRGCPAVWFIQSSAYRAVAKLIFSKLAFELRQTGLLPAVWQLKADEVKGKQGIYYVPQLKLLNEERSPEFIESLKTSVQL
jgi:hypothetical protein